MFWRGMHMSWRWTCSPRKSLWVWIYNPNFYSPKFCLYKVCEEKYTGDGECDYFFNKPECEFDGGDCCVPSPVCIYGKCVCHNETTYTTTTPFPWWGNAITESPETCYFLYYYEDFDIDDIGDGICNDMLNHLACNYDGGDCCFGIKGIACSLCKCKDEYTGYQIVTESPDGKYLFEEKNQ